MKMPIALAVLGDLKKKRAAGGKKPEGKKASPGAAALQAIKDDDPDAFEAAIKRCKSEE